MSREKKKQKNGGTFHECGRNEIFTLKIIKKPHQIINGSKKSMVFFNSLVVGETIRARDYSYPVDMYIIN